MFISFSTLMAARSPTKYCIVILEKIPAHYPQGQLLQRKAPTASVQTPLAISLKCLHNAPHQLIILENNIAISVV